MKNNMAIAVTFVLMLMSFRWERDVAARSQRQVCNSEVLPSWVLRDGQGWEEVGPSGVQAVSTDLNGSAGGETQDQQAERVQ